LNIKKNQLLNIGEYCKRKYVDFWKILLQYLEIANNNALNNNNSTVDFCVVFLRKINTISLRLEQSSVEYLKILQTKMR